MFPKILSAFVLLMGAESEVVNMKVFYETNCPYCQGFIIDELAPLLTSDVRNNVKIEWIPWGNAAESGGAIIAQHGPDELQGNKLHICAAEKFGADHNKMTDFVICHERHIRGDQFAQPPIPPTPAGDEGSYAPCLADVGAPFAPGDLTACANDPSIFDKLRQMGQMSNFAKEHVPWVVFHRGEQNMQGELFTDLCAKLNAKGAHPNGCTVMGRRLLV